MGRTTYSQAKPLSDYDARVILIELAREISSSEVIVPMLDRNGKKVPVLVHIGDDDGSIFKTHNN